MRRRSSPALGVATAWRNGFHPLWFSIGVASGGLSALPIFLKKPAFSRFDIIGEIASAASSSSALDLEACQRLRDHERYTLRSIFLARKQGGKLFDAILCLDLHPADIDQREMLIGAAAQLEMSLIAGRRKAGDVSWLKEASHRDFNQVPSLVDFKGKRRRHKRLVAR